jgi:predicted nucleic acid-binding protein
MDNKRKLFIDTWGWMVILNKREPRHNEIKSFYQKFRAEAGTIYTTDYVLDETITLLFHRLSFNLAKESIELIDTAIMKNFLHLEWISPLRFEEAKKLRLKFQDKPEISFTDLSSMIIIKELGLSLILTEDEHFIHVGMGFERIPQISI